MKNLTITFLTLLTLLKKLNSKNFSSEFETFSCQKNKPSLTLNLNTHESLQFQGKFSISFWFKYKNSNKSTIFSMNTLMSNLNLSINNRNKLIINKKQTNLMATGGSSSLIDFQVRNSSNGWNFIYFFFESPRTKSKTIKFITSLNYEVEKVKQVIFEVDLKGFFVTFGAGKINSNCDSDILFYQCNLYDLKEPISMNSIKTLSYGLLKPVLLSKFNMESSYNKYYSNLLNSGIGDIENGSDTDSFAFFTSLATKNNKYNIKSHLFNNFSVFYLPNRLLPLYEINNSYIFIIQYNFLYKNFKKSNSENKYSHVLYQRFPKEGIEILIKADIDIKISSASSSTMNMRYFSNQQLQRRTPINYQVHIEDKKDDNLYLIPLNFLLVKVEQNSLNRIPKITFINGLDTSVVRMPEEFFELRANDRHLIGEPESNDFNQDEYFTFIEIKEVFFLRGSFFQQNTSSNSNTLYYSGFRQGEENLVLTCKTTNDIKRNMGDSIILLDLINCEENLEVECIDNCDICESDGCVICDPGYELRDLKCVKCGVEEGYDPILKVCFSGQEITEFFDTEFGNLKTTIMDLDIKNNHYFLATLKFDVDQNIFLHNGFLFYLNSRERQNVLIDVCWDEICFEKEQQIYFGLMNKKNNFPIEKIIVGNSNIYAIKPNSLILNLQKNTDFTAGTIIHKNFDCSFIGNYFFQQELGSIHFGKCLKNCSRGFYKDFLTNRCLKCSSKCQTCISTNICISCKKNEALVIGQCLSCQKPCLTCQNNPNSCLSCSNPEMFLDNKCERLCQNKSELCQVCDIYSGKCLKCKLGFSLRGGKCEENKCFISNCKICFSGDSCRLCESGFVLENKNCRVCSNNCTFCPFGYKLTVDSSCVRDKLVDVVVFERENEIVVRKDDEKEDRNYSKENILKQKNEGILFVDEEGEIEFGEINTLGFFFILVFRILF